MQGPTTDEAPTNGLTKTTHADERMLATLDRGGWKIRARNSSTQSCLRGSAPTRAHLAGGPRETQSWRAGLALRGMGGGKALPEATLATTAQAAASCPTQG